MNIVDRLNHHLFKDTVWNYFQCSFSKNTFTDTFNISGYYNRKIILSTESTCYSGYVMVKSESLNTQFDLTNVSTECDEIWQFSGRFGYISQLLRSFSGCVELC